MNTFTETISHLKEEGFKITKYRLAILELFHQYDKPVSVGDIISYLEKKKLNPNKTTVYREVDALVSLGLVHVLVFGDEKKRYERASLEHHHHLICQNCDRVEDIILHDDVKAIEQKVQSKSKFKIQSHSLEFFGLCTKCQ